MAACQPSTSGARNRRERRQPAFQLLRALHRRIYIDELRKPALAEAYADRVYAKTCSGGGGGGDLPLDAADAQPPETIYLQLIQVGARLPSAAVVRKDLKVGPARRGCDPLMPPRET